MKNFFKRYQVILLISYLVLVAASVMAYVIKKLIDLDVFILFNLLLVVIFVGLMITRWKTRHRRNRINQLENKIRETNIMNRRKANNEDIALNYLPVGIIIYDDAYGISYANKAAKDFFSNVLVERPLSVLNQELFHHVENRIGKFMVEIYGKKFDVVHYPKNNTLYMFEETEREEIKEKYNNQQHVLGMLTLDNYVEATANMDYQRKSTIEGLMLGILNQWCREHDMYFISLRVDKAILLTNRKSLNQLMDDEFSVLQKISKAADDHDIRVSLSMGIAAIDGSFVDLGESAEEALKLAIDRGGDQVVVNIQNQPTKFFGGKSNAYVKTSKVIAKVTSKALGDYLETASNVLMMPHKTSDIDALGASIGLLEMALAKQKDAKIILDYDSIDQTCQKVVDMFNHEYVKLNEYIITPEDAIQLVSDETLLILVDHHSPLQSNAPDIFERTKNIVVIDHHRRIEETIPDLLINYIEPSSSSSVELVTELIEFFNEEVKIHKFEATMMLAGMMIDTNNFSYHTGARTFEAAAKLRLFGADPSQAKLILRESLDDIKTKSNLVNKAKIINDRFAITALDDIDIADRVQLAKTADELLEIDNIIAAFVIGKLDDDTIGISARSINHFNVSVLMEKFGGGGHLNTAAAQIKNGQIDDIIKEIEKLIAETYKEETTMKVILKNDVKGKGKKGDVIEVATGYGNYLLTSKNAVKANPANLEALEKEKAEKLEKENKAYHKALALKEEIEKSPITLYVKIGESGKLFGSINTKQIADEMKKQHQITIDKRKIVLDDKINTLGDFKLEVKLHKKVVANISVQVLEKE